MSEENKLRESLFDVEPVSPEQQQRFREELAQIVEPRLARSHRLYYQVTLACSVVGILGTAGGFVKDAEHRPLLALCLLVWIAFAGWIFHILRRGSEPLRSMQAMSKAMAGISMAGAAFLIFLAIQNPSIAGVVWAILGLFVFLVTSFINVWNRVILAERTTREHILRVEYRVASLASRMSVSSK